MQRVMNEPGEPSRRDMGDVAMQRAELSAGPRVSWGTVLSGAVALLAVALIVWALAFAVISLAAHPTPASLKGSAIALFVCSVIATLAGAFAGGTIVGRLLGGARRPVALAHGFLAWGLAFLVAFAFHVWMFRTALAAMASALADSVAAQAAGPAPLAPSRADAIYAGTVALDYLRGAGWFWFGTWFLAGVLALAGAALGARLLGVRRRPEVRSARGEEREGPQGPPPPLTPAPST